MVHVRKARDFELYCYTVTVLFSHQKIFLGINSGINETYIRCAMIMILRILYAKIRFMPNCFLEKYRLLFECFMKVKIELRGVSTQKNSAPRQCTLVPK